MAKPTSVAGLLAELGAVTCDEYVHLLVMATMDPSPALVGWQSHNRKGVRYPLCFALKYMLAKAYKGEAGSHLDDIIQAYVRSGFSGAEDYVSYLELASGQKPKPHDSDFRQERESIRFISQLSYLHANGQQIVASLDQDEARHVFDLQKPMPGPYEESGDNEIQRLAN